MVQFDNINTTQILLAIITAIPGFVAALVAAMISWHNKDAITENSKITAQTKHMVNGRMNELLEAAKELAAYKARDAARLEELTGGPTGKVRE